MLVHMRLEVVKLTGRTLYKALVHAFGLVCPHETGILHVRTEFNLLKVGTATEIVDMECSRGGHFRTSTGTAKKAKYGSLALLMCL